MKEMLETLRDLTLLAAFLFGCACLAIVPAFWLLGGVPFWEAAQIAAVVTSVIVGAFWLAVGLR